MDSYYQLALKSQDAAFLLKVSPDHKRSLFDRASFRLALLYRLAKEENVYALMKLYQLNVALEDLLATLKRKIRYSRRAIQKKLECVVQATVSVQMQSQLRCNTALAVKLMLMLKLFDDYVVALVHAKHAHVFEQQNDFYRLKNNMKAQVCKLLSMMTTIRSEHYPQVTLRHYLANAACYQEAIKIYGDISPHDLQKALASSVTPDFTTENLNRYLSQLSLIET